VRRGAVIVLLASGCGRLAFDVTPAAADAADSMTSASDAAGACAPTNGLLAAWPLDAADIVGTTILDRSGNGRHGEMIGTPAPSSISGRVATAIDFSSAPFSYVNVDNLPLNTVPGELNTIALWFRNDNPNVNEGVFCLPAGPVAGPPRNCLWLTTPGPAPISLSINGGQSECWGIEDAGLIGRWVHVVGIYINGATVGGSLYIDGAPVTMGCRFGVCDQSRVAAAPFELGNSDSSYAWRGMLDDVRVYDRGLSAAEIAKLFACAP
jgi:hypothetical protein